MKKILKDPSQFLAEKKNVAITKVMATLHNISRGSRRIAKDLEKSWSILNNRTENPLKIFKDPSKSLAEKSNGAVLITSAKYFEGSRRIGKNPDPFSTTGQKILLKNPQKSNKILGSKKSQQRISKDLEIHHKAEESCQILDTSTENPFKKRSWRIFRDFWFHGVNWKILQNP